LRRRTGGGSDPENAAWSAGELEEKRRVINPMVRRPRLYSESSHEKEEEEGDILLLLMLLTVVVVIAMVGISTVLV